MGVSASLVADLVPPSVDPDDARRTAEDVLSRAEYLEPQPSLVERALAAGGRALSSLVDALTGGGPGGTVAAVVTFALVAGALWLLVRALRARPVHVSAAGPAVRHATSALDDPAAWDAEADRLAAAGDRRGALRCRYQAFVARLLQDRLVEATPGRTPRERAAELAQRHPDLAPAVHDVTVRFEQVWFGGVEPTAAELERFGVDTVDLASSIRSRPAPVAA